VFAGQPTSGTAGTYISPFVAVGVQDESGNPVDGFFKITLALGANPGGGVLGGQLTQETGQKPPPRLAIFPFLTLSKPGAGYTLVASSPGLTSATSTAFNMKAQASVAAFDPVGQFGQRPATWYVRYSNAPGAPDVAPFVYGGGGWKPV